MSNNDKLFAAVETDRMNAMLDEALGETFPASDPVAITPIRHIVDEDEAVASDAAIETVSAGDAARDTHRRPIREGNRR